MNLNAVAEVGKFEVNGVDLKVLNFLIHFVGLYGLYGL